MSIPDTESLCGLQVSPQRGVIGRDHLLGQVAVDDAQLALDEGVAIIVSVNARGLEVARAGKDGAKIFVWKSEVRRFGSVKHKKFVAAGGDIPLHAEEVAERRACTVADRVPVVLGVTRIHGPLAGLAQFFSRDEIAGMRLGQRARQGSCGSTGSPRTD